MPPDPCCPQPHAVVRRRLRPPHRPGGLLYLRVGATPDRGVHPEQADDSDVVPGFLRDLADDAIGRMLPVVDATTRWPPSTVRRGVTGQEDRPVPHAHGVRT